ncbi:hypothetical protein T492DRAFT_894686 [Pavlovales sp. CCMP2436]|nr:hypothetical protein T492DRAFT_894686 [Pavlovales sp. CCMP2436]
MTCFNTSVQKDLAERCARLNVVVSTLDSLAFSATFSQHNGCMASELDVSASCLEDESWTEVVRHAVRSFCASDDDVKGGTTHDVIFELYVLEHAANENSYSVVLLDEGQDCSRAHLSTAFVRKHKEKNEIFCIRGNPSLATTGLTFARVTVLDTFCLAQKVGDTSAVRALVRKLPGGGPASVYSRDVLALACKAKSVPVDVEINSLYKLRPRQ